MDIQIVTFVVKMLLNFQAIHKINGLVCRPIHVTCYESTSIIQRLVVIINMFAVACSHSDCLVFSLPTARTGTPRYC